MGLVSGCLMIRFDVYERLINGEISNSFLVIEHNRVYQHLPIKGDDVFLPEKSLEKVIEFLKGGENELDFEVLGRQFFYHDNKPETVAIKVVETLESYNSRTGHRGDIYELR